MKKRLLSILMTGILTLMLFSCVSEPKAELTLDTEALSEHLANLPAVVRTRANAAGIQVSVNGAAVTNLPYPAYMDENLNVLLSREAAQELFACTIRFNADGKLVVYNGDERVRIATADERNGFTYVLADDVARVLGAQCSWSVRKNALLLTGARESEPLPVSYDYRDEGRQSPVRDQGETGICWSLAAMTAMETSLLPGEAAAFGVDHLTYRNTYGISGEDGGTFLMATAYALSWTGPVSVDDDPYGDYYAPEDLSAVRHVQEVRLYGHGETQELKEAVYRYGGVKASIFMDMDNPYTDSVFYNTVDSAYCYKGDKGANHDVVIIGWDDTFPASSFTQEVEGDGAFICQNSWGRMFGDQGVFYISYYDDVIGSDACVYAVVQDADNYDRVYQSDLCGWVGQIGYNETKAYFANVYTAKETEQIEAVGFYATGKDTEYKIWFTGEFADESSLSKAEELMSGTLSDEGFYTITLPQPQVVEAGKDFAIVVRVDTPGSIQPVAIEFAAGDLTDVDLSDGRSFISYDRQNWEALEETQSCNVCLKAYSRPVQ